MVPFFLATPAWALGPDRQSLDLLTVPWQISADRITHYKDPDRVVAEGHVVLTHNQPGTLPLTIEGDWVQYDRKEGLVTARGNLLVTSGEDRLQATEAVIDLEQQTGTLNDATLFYSRNNFHLSGTEIRKTGAQTYQLKDAIVTTCKISPEKPTPWSITSGSVRITVDGYAILTNATMRIHDVPCLYLPYLILPAKTTRQSGLLFPEISQSSRNGAGFISPLFVNLSPSADLTLFPGWLTERGPLAGMEFRYVGAPESSGVLLFNYLDDHLEESKGDEYKSDGYVRTQKDRYWLRGKVNHEFSNGVTGRLDLDLVSDRDYLEEFRQGMTGFNQTDKELLSLFGCGLQEKTIPFRESDLELSKVMPTSFLGGELRAVNDVEDMPTATPELQTLPRFVYIGREHTGLPGLDLTWGSEYVHYWRENGIGDHRLDLHPRLFSSFPSALPGFLEGTVSYGLRETIYEKVVYGDPGISSWEDDHFEDRTLYDVNATLGTTLARAFFPEMGPFTTISHTVRPEIGYGYIPAEDQDTLPDLDDLDRIKSQSQLTYSLTNFFNLFKPAAAGILPSPYYSRLKLSQSYDLRESGGDTASLPDEQHPFSDVSLIFDLTAIKNISFTYDTAISMYGQGVTHYDIITRYHTEQGERLSLDYRYNRTPGLEPPYYFTDEQTDSLHELNLSLGMQLLETLTAEYSLAHSWTTSKTVESSVRLTYQPSCWGVELLASQASDENRVAILFSFTGIGKVMEFGLPQL